MFKLEKKEKNKVLLEIEIPSEKVNEALEKAYYKLRNQFVIPGFRKGKAPRKMIESRYGREVFFAEALEMLADPAYREAIKEAELEPINQPELEPVQLEQDKPLVLKVNLEVKPEVQLGAYKGLAVEAVRKTITDAEVDKFLEELRERHSRLVTLEEGALQEKDLAIVDFRGTIEGEPFNGSEAENYSLQIGSGTFIEDFEEQLVGAVQGEQREVKVTFPDDYQHAELAGKEAVFHVEVKEIKRPQLPPLDDDFVQEITEEFQNLADYRADVQGKLEEEMEKQYKLTLEKRLIALAAENSTLDLPDILVEREIDAMMQEFDYFLRMQRLTLKQYARMVEGGMGQLREERREEAMRRTRISLVLAAIIKAEGIEASEADIDQQVGELKKRFKMKGTLEEAREKLAVEGRMEMIKHEVCYRKVMDLLLENAEITEKTEEQAAGEETV